MAEAKDTRQVSEETNDPESRKDDENARSAFFGFVLRPLSPIKIIPSELLGFAPIDVLIQYLHSIPRGTKKLVPNTGLLPLIVGCFPA